MRIIIDAHKEGRLHHAYVIEGKKDIVVPELIGLLERHVGVETKGNPDFWYGEFDTFTIDDGRQLKEMQLMKSLDGKKRVFVVAFNFITVEAQNSLLKIFEEPGEGVHFFVITPSAEILLPTLRSRVMIIQKGSEAEKENIVAKFVAVQPAERLEMLKEIIENKDKAVAIDFVNKLEVVLYSKKKKLSPKDFETVFEEILKCKSYLNDRAPSVKIILEHLALIIPVLK